MTILQATKNSLTGEDIKTSNLFIIEQSKAVVNPEYYAKISPFVVMVGLSMDDPNTVTMGLREHWIY